MPTRFVQLVVVCSLAVCFCGPLRAAAPTPAAPAPGEPTRLAKMHFSLGKAHVQRHEYEEAIREFETGYQLKALPLFLYNIGQVARAAGLHAKALDAFERYLRADPHPADHAELERSMVTLRQTIAREKAAAPPAAPATPPPVVATAKPLNLTLPAAALVASPPPAVKSHSRRTLWIVLGSVGGALVIGGVATAIALSVQSSSDVPGGYHDIGTVHLGAQ